MFELNRIQANDPSFRDVRLDYRKVINPRKNFEALYYNTQVQRLVVVWDERIAPLQRRDYVAFATMLATNKSIQDLELVFLKDKMYHHTSTHWRPVMSALIKYGGDSIRVKTLTIENCTHNVSDLSMLADLLRRYPCIAQHLDVSFRTEVTTKAESLLKAIFSSRVESLILRGTWYQPEHVATAIKSADEHHIKDLSLQVTPRMQGSSPLWKAVESDTTLTSITMYASSPMFAESPSRRADAPSFVQFLEHLPLLRNVRAIRIYDFDARFLDAACQAVQAHGQLDCLDLQWYSSKSDARYATRGISPTVFQGIKKLALSAELPESEQMAAIADEATVHICTALQSNPSIETLNLGIAGISLRGFHAMTQLWPTLPSLQAVDIREDSGRPFSSDRVCLVREAVRQSSKLCKVLTNPPSVNADTAILDEIAYYCERNRIRIVRLLRITPPTSLYLWPLAIAKVNHTSVRYKLVRAKPELLAGAGASS
jgi:hypothetical protein